MKSLIYFLFLIFSFFLYAENSQIILDPFQGWPAPEENKQEDSSSAGEGGFFPNLQKKQIYTAECSLTEIEGGFSEKCILKDISYEVESCASEGKNSENDEDPNCLITPVTRDKVDETELPQYPLEEFLKQPVYLKECSIFLFEDGSYSESCNSPDVFEGDEKNENSSEDFDVSEEQSIYSNIEQIINETNELKEIEVPELVEKAIGGVGRIVVDFGHEDRGLGSGFFIKDDEGQPIFITNYHVFGSVLRLLFRLSANGQDWFLEDSNVLFYVQQGGQKFRIKGVRDMSLIMDLAVLEVENYTGDTLNLVDEYSNEAPIYALGYPRGGSLKKIKAAHPFLSSELHTSFMVSAAGCRTLKGMSGGPALNSTGGVVGVVFAIDMSANCKNLKLIPIEGFMNVKLMSSLKTNKRDIADLIREKELLFYDQLLSDSGLRGDLILRAVMYVGNNMFFSNFLHSTKQDYLLSIDQKLSESTQELNEKDRRELRFLVQKNIAVMQGMDVEKAAQEGSLEAKFALGRTLYIQSQFEKAHQIFQGLVQIRVPLHLYILSQIYYREENISQACRLLTYAGETIEVLDDLYQEYECDDVLSEI